MVCGFLGDFCVRVLGGFGGLRVFCGPRGVLGYFGDPLGFYVVLLVFSDFLGWLWFYCLLLGAWVFGVLGFGVCFVLSALGCWWCGL